MSKAFDKGNKLANRLLDIYEQNADYISSLSPEFRGNFEEDLNQSFGLFNMMKQLAEQYNQTAITQRVEKFMKTRSGGQ